MRRRTLVVAVAVAVVISTASTWVAAQQIRSPAEEAARTAPPVASPILVPVVEQVLATRIVTRGTAHFGSPRKLRVVPSRLKTGARVITDLAPAGSRLGAGEVVATISGRPVFVLQGRQPMYRDLGPGMTGRDVRQVERALQRAGFAPGAVDGVYDAGTEAAVSALYRRHDFQPLVASAAQVAAARPLEATMTSGGVGGGGVQLPSDEVVFVAKAPLRVTDLTVGLGDSPERPIATVTDSDVVIDGFVRVEQAGKLRTGAKVLVQEPALGIDTVGKVKSIAPRPGTNGADGFHVFFEVAVPDPPAALVDASVRLTVPIRSTTEAQLTVPVAAVSLAPDGSARVRRSEGDRVDFVPVETGLAADGYVAVTADAGSLDAGDMVVVGFKGDRRRAAG